MLLHEFFLLVPPHEHHRVLLCRLTSLLCSAGIANALDLTDRILPRLQARPLCRPLLLHFPPYSRQELSSIIQDRLVQVVMVEFSCVFIVRSTRCSRVKLQVLFPQVSSEGVLDGSALQFCVRKVSAVSGDARKALDICR